MAAIEPRAALTVGSAISRRRQAGHFLRHYLEMCAPMCVGFAVGDLIYFSAAARFGYSKPFSELPELSVVVVTFTMTAPMVAWMLFCGMPRRETSTPAARPTRASLNGKTVKPVASAGDVGIDLYWLPLGAGGHSVRWNGRVFEWVAAALERRARCELYHSALDVRVPEARFVIEQAPAWRDSAERGVVAEGAVGARALGRFRLFRYEVRLWRAGVVPDVAEAVDSPQRVSDDLDRARSLLELVPRVPTPVWGRDEISAGEMWNSNSLISWLLVQSGLDVESVHPPIAGRAPGWNAGIVVAHRQLANADALPRIDVGQLSQLPAAGRAG